MKKELSFALQFTAISVVSLAIAFSVEARSPKKIKHKQAVPLEMKKSVTK
ncbi:MAG: hypothetical protein ABIP95_02425 [Pelobium sp.]